jgi:4-cresol dehydrogenase (hydroxylating)
VVALAYDREVEGEDERALACHDALRRKLSEAGYPPIRLGIQSPLLSPAPEDDSERVLGALKGALDPNGILAPERYLR